MPEFAQLWPEKFNNKTNGVAPRRWLLKANPELTELISQTLGENSGSPTCDRAARPGAVRRRRGLPRSVQRGQAPEQAEAGAASSRTRPACCVDPDSMFDVQIKRIHEYKRQLLNVLRIIHDYLRHRGGRRDAGGAAHLLFAGKAAPGYWAAKQIIKLIHNVADVVNNDPKAQRLDQGRVPARLPRLAGRARSFPPPT